MSRHLFWLEENIKTCPVHSTILEKSGKQANLGDAVCQIVICPICDRYFVKLPKGYDYTKFQTIDANFLKKKTYPVAEAKVAIAESSTDTAGFGYHVKDKSLQEEATHILKKLYGSDAQFRPGQYEAIERTLLEKRLLVVQKTGWGKSLVYFICTKILREKGSGLTLVISPLLALMENQLEAARKLGLSCEALNSATWSRYNEILQKMIDNKLDLVLATPEKLYNKKVREKLKDIRIGLMVIDEAHCISDWGHDFRMEYSLIYKVINQLQPNVPILATTATANDKVIEDLTAQMGTPNISRGPLMRNNLSIQILNMPDRIQRYAWILDNIPKLKGSGIIYCITKIDCRWLAEFLRTNGINAEAYYSGNEEDEEKSRQVLNHFLHDEIKVIVSTIKLGMGFDKGNVSFVIHYQCPKNVIAYYQQIGRAGRNIPFARTFLMFGEEDIKIQNSFIKNAFPTEHEMRTVRDFVTHNPGTTIPKICSEKDIKKKRIIKALDFLENEGYVDKDWKVSSAGNPYAVYRSTANAFRYNGSHYEELRESRYNELSQMLSLSKTTECYGRTIVNILDDKETCDCGVCAICNPEGKLSAETTSSSRNKASDYINLYGAVIPIIPWQFWPKNSCISERKNDYPNIEGIALSKYGNGLGALVRKGKYEDKRFDDIFIRKAVHFLKPVIKKYDIGYLTCVPSQTTQVVPDFAKRLALACGLQYLELLIKTNTSHQKDKENEAHQFVNAVISFEAKTGAVFPERIILVDDMVDSGLTLAVCGHILGVNGCKTVYPLALADSGSGDREEDIE